MQRHCGRADREKAEEVGCYQLAAEEVITTEVSQLATAVSYFYLLLFIR